ncbi:MULTISPECIES: helix-turn-helix transcriptional regulator [Thermoactinomyces]|uniref:Helix-turn-helix transcriptional regulator n=1 Tax=Thermoactinomyces daqus TaxID=1329516 RepID=A0A7W1XC26_9BACL|nr:MULTISPECIES: helix-turn-helix transcriptional regulator [Thermoactinomyces]MBA4543819.1 helix-turn-helix transcriptional regulator [Thermoactinomyces daqus]MBH8609094.1 helix-turn-helix transcriptional regulator [Thermoactinomyces sp. CICC 10521]
MFSARLRAARKSLGLNQKDLAKKIGVKPTTYSNWETDVALPRAEELKKLSNVLGVSIDYLLGVTDDPRGKIDVSDIALILEKEENLFWKNKKLSPDLVEEVKDFIEFVLKRKDQE